MSDEGQIRWQAVPPLLLVVLLAVGSFWWLPYALDPERLPQHYAGVPVEGVQQAEARLWEDPFAAASRDQARKETTPAERCGLTWLTRLTELADDKCHREASGCLVLGIMVSGGPYTGSQEFRRATRYAVLAGLSRQGLIPDDTEHIGWVDPTHPDSPQQAAGADQTEERTRPPGRSRPIARGTCGHTCPGCCPSSG